MYLNTRKLKTFSIFIIWIIFIIEFLFYSKYYYIFLNITLFIIGKGIAALTFDKDYQRKRQEQLNIQPATLQEGLARSGKGLVMVSEN